VGIKAKTPEGLNQDHVAQAHAVVLLETLDDNERMSCWKPRSTTPPTVDEVLTHLGVSEGLGSSKSRRMVPLPVFDTEDIT
jgi:2-C-methyl-D-erythritol 2,4-cyclodiphosphate synthase